MKYRTYVCQFGKYWYVNVDEVEDNRIGKDLIVGPYETRSIARKVCKSISATFAYAHKQMCNVPNDWSRS